MRKTFLPSLLVLSLSFSGFCQSIYRAYQFPDKIPDKYVIRPLDDYNRLLKSDTKGLKPDEAKRFAEEMSYRKANDFNSGYVYIGWDEAEDYLNKVLQKMIPEKEKNNTLIHVYPGRSSVYNAYALHDGTIFFNIALLAELDNEAALACILGHELSHYLNRDVKKSYLQRMKLNTRKNRNKDNKALKEINAYYSREQEHAADSVGAVMAAKAGYDIKYGTGNFYKFLEIEKKEEQKDDASDKHIVMAIKNEDNVNPDSLKSKKMQDQVLASHPENIVRINYYKKFIELYNTKDPVDYSVSKSEQFRNLQAKSRLESLHILLEDYENRECVQRAFAFHLFDPDNEAYVFYILEGLRRDFILNPGSVTHTFLTDDLKPGLFEKGEGILHNLHALILDTVSYKTIKAKELLNDKEIEFETYDEAFNYFADLAIAKKYNESLFPIALRNSDTIPLRDEYLKQYVSIKGAEYEDFAKALLSNNLVSGLKSNSKQLLLLDNIVFLEDHSYGYHNRFILSGERSPSYISALKDMVGKKFSGKELNLYSDLAKSHPGKAVEYRNLLQLSAIMKVKKDEASKMESFDENSNKSEENLTEKLFTMNPDFWYLMNNEKLKSIEWISTIAFDDNSKLNLKLLNPFFWLGGGGGGFAYSTGSTRYAYLIMYYSFNPFSKEKKVYYNEDIVGYKMSKTNYLNTIYHNLKATK